MSFDFATIELIVILLLVASQARDSFLKADRAEEIRSATMEGARKGWECHRELTARTIGHIDEMYAVAYEGLAKDDRVDNVFESIDFDAASEISSELEECELELDRQLKALRKGDQ